MLPKVLNATNTVFALICVILSIVALCGVSWHTSVIRGANWAHASFTAEIAPSADVFLKYSTHANLWGRVTTTDASNADADEYVTGYSNDQCVQAPAIGDASDGPALRQKSCSAYELRDTFYAFVVLTFVFALVKMVLAAVALCKPARPVLVGNIICSFFTFLWSLVLWTLWYSKVYPQDLKFDAGLGELSYSMGPGFQSTIALCWFAFANIFVSIVHMVTAGNEGGEQGVAYKTTGKV